MCIRVLIADDHDLAREGLRALLTAEPGIEVVGEAADGREAVRRAAELQPDVVIVDLAMPQLNGVEAMRQIAQVSPGARTIALSMYSNSEHVFRALQAGARGYLPKETAGREVVPAVRAVHAGGRHLSQKVLDVLVEGYLHHPGLAQAAGPLESLSAREREIFQLVVEGKSSADIAEDLDLSPKTVDTYRSRLMRKLGVEDVPGLVKFAVAHGLTPLD